MMNYPSESASDRVDLTLVSESQAHVLLIVVAMGHFPTVDPGPGQHATVELHLHANVVLHDLVVVHGYPFPCVLYALTSLLSSSVSSLLFLSPPTSPAPYHQPFGWARRPLTVQQAPMN